MCIIINQGSTEKRYWQATGTEVTYPLIGATAQIAAAHQRHSRNITR